MRDMFKPKINTAYKPPKRDINIQHKTDFNQSQTINFDSNSL